jgi:uncharacterized Zn finger protein
MGMYDSVNLNCPNCGADYEAQSKGGDCSLSCYNLNEAPADVLSDVNRHAPFECEECGCVFKVELKIFAIERRINDRIYFKTNG